MKRFHIYIVAILAFAGITTSCSKDETKSLDVPSKSILVSMPGETGSTTFDSSNITSLEPTTVPTGWTVDDINMYTATITVTAPSSFDNDEVESGTLTLKGYTPTGNTKSVSIQLAIIPNEVDFTDAPANCYVACKPKTRYIFDHTRGGNGSVELATAKIKVVWQSNKDIVKYLDIRNGKGVFYVAPKSNDKEHEDNKKVVPGNAVIGAYDINGNLIWSWHIWVTNSDPMSAENTFTLGGKTMMNFNLGASTNNEGDTDHDAIYQSYGVLYQWGRKDPIPGSDTWNFNLNYDDVIYDFENFSTTLRYVESSEGGSIEWTTANPLSIIIGNPDNAFDWLSDDHDDTLWSATTKTDNDPCPAGWCLPDSSVFESLTIAANDDAMPWEDAQKMYGWWLEDTATGDKHFFSAAGRRNYLDGRLDNMNVNYDCPVPWSGYYWTTTTDGDSAKALYFNLNSNTRTWNGIETARSMQRANAMSVRCVKM